MTRLRAAALVVLPIWLILCQWLVFHQQKMSSWGWRALIFREAILFLSVSTVALLIVVVAISIENKSGRWRLVGILGGIAAILSTMPAFIYLGSLITDSLFGESLTFQVFSSFILRPTYIVSLLGASNPDATLIFSVLFGGAVFSFLTAGIACYVYCTWLAAAVFEAVANGRGGERWFRHGIRWLSISIAIVSTLCLVLLTDNRQALAFDESEPIIAFFKHFPSNDLSAVSRARVASINEDRLVRAEYPKREKFEAKNVVLIISDALRADHMGVYGYRRSTTPFLSTLLSNGLLHRVDMTLSSCSETYCGVTTTFASRPFYKVSPYNFGIHNLLHDMGFRINFFLSGYHELPRNLKYMRQSDVDMLFYPYSLALKGPSDDKNLLTALEEAPSYNGQPNFFYFHLMSTHAAGAKSPKFEEFKPASWLPYLEDVMYSRRKGRKLDDKFAVNPLNSEDQRSLVN